MKEMSLHFFQLKTAVKHLFYTGTILVTKDIVFMDTGSDYFKYLI